ncbi:MAG: ion channel [Planctomycetota bacterium]
MPGGNSWLSRNRFSVLLLALTLLLITAPLVNYLGPGFWAHVLMLLFFSLTLLSSVLAISSAGLNRLAALLLVIPAFAFGVIELIWPLNFLILTHYVLSSLFIGFVLGMIAHQMFTSRMVTVDIIAASICAYLLLAMLFAMVYSAIALVLPGSFSYSAMSEVANESMRFGGDTSFVPLYYSIVTMTTLGYGDIIPISPVAQVTAAFQAILGQVYIAVVVARLVGMHVAQALTAEQKN